MANKKNKKADGNSNETNGEEKKPKVKLLGSVKEIEGALEKAGNIGERLSKSRGELKELRKEAVLVARLVKMKSNKVSEDDHKELEAKVNKKKDQVKTLAQKLALPKKSYFAIRRRDIEEEWAVLSGQNVEDVRNEEENGEE